MAGANAMRISELDFDSIKQNLKNYLRSQPEFTDFDFEGAGMNVLLDVLAYNTHYMGYYLNMVGNEAFLDTAQLRSSILSHAKHTNYLPTSMIGATANVNIVVTPQAGQPEDTTLTLPRYTTFISEPLNGTNYVFCTTTARTATKANGVFRFNNVEIKQGEPIAQSFTGLLERRIKIPSSNVDTSTITVTVQKSSVDTTIETFTLSNDLTEVTANSTVFFLEENSDQANRYTLTFGDGILGKQITQDNIVTIRYLDTAGSFANKVNTFSLFGTVGPYTDATVISNSAAAGGAEKETIEQIRFRAPIAYTTQNRAVTVNDYQSLIAKDYPNIDAVSVWSGDENDPPIYGKTFISLKPKQNFFITELEKDRIKREIIQKRAVLTVTPEIVDPDYVYLLVNAKVNYNPNITSLSEDEIQQLVRTAIIQYRDDELQKFDSTLRISALQKAIDNAHESILGSSVTVYVQKRIELTLNQPKNYDINFNMQLYRGQIEDKLYTFPKIVVNDLDGIPRDVFIEDTPNSLSGIDSISVTNTGSGYLSPPTVTITGDGSGAVAKARILNGRVVGIDVISRGIDYTAATAVITSDTGSGATAKVNLQLRNGILRTFYYKTNGEKVIVNTNAGTIDYINGRVSLILLPATGVAQNDRYDDNFLTINVVPFDYLILPLRNRILDIDDADSASISIEMVPEL